MAKPLPVQSETSIMVDCGEARFWTKDMDFDFSVVLSPLMEMLLFLQPATKMLLMSV